MRRMDARGREHDGSAYARASHMQKAPSQPAGSFSRKELRDDLLSIYSYSPKSEIVG